MKKIKNKIMDIANSISEDEIFTRAAALAYYTALALAPLMILFVWFLSTLDLNLQRQLIEEVRNFMGVEAATIMSTIISGAEERPDLNSISGWIGFIGLMISASIIFVQMQTTFNKIFEADQEEDVERGKLAAIMDVVKRRLLSVGMLLAFVFIAIVSLLVSSALSYMLGKSNLVWLEILNSVLSFSVIAVLFTVIYKWMPDRRLDYRSSAAGGVLTALLFAVGKYLIGLYLGQAALGSAYGAAGSLVVLLAWVYFSSLIVFIGAEVSYVVFVHKKYEATDGKFDPKTNPDFYLGQRPSRPRTT